MDMELIHPAVRSSWFSGLSSWSNWSMKDIVDKMKHMCFNAIASRFAPADDDNTCSVNKDANSCNAIDQCSWCATRSDKAMELSSDCRKSSNARELPPDAWNCSKIPAEVKNATRKRLGAEFGKALHMEFFTEKAMKCTHGYWTDENACKADSDCSWCGPSEGAKAFIKVEKHKQPKCIPHGNAIEVPSMFIECDGIDASEHTWLTTMISRLSYWAAFGQNTEEKRMLFADMTEEWQAPEEPKHHKGKRHHSKGWKHHDEKKDGCCSFMKWGGLIHAVLMIANCHFIRHLRIAVKEEEPENEQMVQNIVEPEIMAPSEAYSGSVSAPVAIN